MRAGRHIWIGRLRSTVLALYDALRGLRDDLVVRLNRCVALAQVAGVGEALQEVEAFAAAHGVENYAPHHAVRADLLRRAGRDEAARVAYDAALALIVPPAERAWLLAQRALIETPTTDPTLPKDPRTECS